MTTSPQTVYHAYSRAFEAQDLGGLAATFADDAIVAVHDQLVEGRAAIRRIYADLFADIPDAVWRVCAQNFGRTSLFLRWEADSRLYHVTGGATDFFFGGGLIRSQSLRYTLQPQLRLVPQAT